MGYLGLFGFCGLGLGGLLVCGWLYIHDYGLVGVAWVGRDIDFGIG